jgi:hypothetical protein
MGIFEKIIWNKRRLPWHIHVKIAVRLLTSPAIYAILAVKKPNVAFVVRPKLTPNTSVKKSLQA